MAKKASRLDRQDSLFEFFKTGTWTPPSELPVLSQFKDVYLDTEYDPNGSSVVAVGTSISLKDGRKFYFPHSHRDGGNLDKEKVREWHKRELRGKRVVGLNIGGDAKVLRGWGVDLEEQGCVLHDVAHAAALLNENRYGNEFTLERLGQEYAKRGKVDHGGRPQDIWKAHSSMIGPYAEEDADLCRAIDEAQQPQMEQQGLLKVQQVEDELIWANIHMESSGARLDMPKLADWRQQAAEQYADLILDIWRDSKVKLRPNAAKSWAELHDALGLKKHYGDDGGDSYTDEYLKGVQHPTIQKGLRARRISSIQSKYLDKYFEMQRGGVLYFKLYQLRSDEESRGTVVGRYSSASPNIQQVFKPENQAAKFGDIGFVIRELMIPDDGFDFFAADGSQLQFRLFAHYSMDDDLIGAYRHDLELLPGEKPIDFHQMVADLFHLSRQAAKHNNFAMILGMGREKLANRLGLGCVCREPGWWNWQYWKQAEKDYEARREHLFGNNDNHHPDCPARKSNDMADEYDRKFPAARKTMERVSKTAEERGYIKTLLGRRRRFQDAEGTVINHKFYSAFAGLLQGSEADIVKSKIITLYRERKTIGIHKLRMPVHDEIAGDIEKGEQARARLKDALAHYEIPLRVPLIWTTSFGANWKEAH